MLRCTGPGDIPEGARRIAPRTGNTAPVGRNVLHARARPGALMRLDHACLNVRDLDRAIDYYTRHFRMTLFSRKEIKATNAEIAFVGYEENGMKVELTHWRDWGPDAYTDGSLFDHIAIVVDEDLDALVNRLRDAGVEIAMAPFNLDGGSTRIAFVLDADGNWVELIHRA
jgi:lactoylglutathione lyase